jgi:PKD repeat protein
VVHLGGPENISDEQIHSAIDVLNEDFNAANNDINFVVQAFQDIVAYVNVEFRLARLDPDGNCTNGINRVFSPSTNDGDSNMKFAAPTWGRESYLNIWVCNQIGGGAAGYAFLPWSVSGFDGAAIDGIVLLHNYVGRIGTSNPTRSHALSHEVGHWINLRHPWGNSNNPGLASNCNEDDGVTDTPETIGWTTCDLDGESCGSLDNVENFMDYSYCYKMFTEGQKVRMRASLNSTVAQRNQLHTEINLIETGVLGEAQVCVADFQTNREPMICVGESLEFDDISFNGVSEVLWTFEGGDPATSSSFNPEVVYNTPGTYSVTLTASNEVSSETVTREGFVRVLPSGSETVPFEEDFEDVADLQGSAGWFDINPDESIIGWELTDLAAYSGNTSVRVRGRSNSNFAIEALTSPTFALEEVDSEAILTFKYAHARRTFSSDDKLSVYISWNCGESWNWRGTWEGDDLPTVTNFVSGQFVPSSLDQWSEITIPNITSLFLNDDFRVRFEFESFNGNNIYIDDINLFDAATLSALSEELVEDLTIFPNPARGNATLTYSFKQEVQGSLVLRDVSGRVVKTFVLPLGAEGRFEFPIDDLSSGLYLVELRQEQNALAVRKLIVE